MRGFFVFDVVSLVRRDCNHRCTRREADVDRSIALSGIERDQRLSPLSINHQFNREFFMFKTTASLMLTLALAGLSILGTSDARAATVSRLNYQNGGNACTGALPTFEGALRKRPQAIANEGTSTAFVTCSLEANDLNSARGINAFMSFANSTASAASVNCTLVDGNAFAGAVTQTASFTVGAGSTARVANFYPVSPATQFTRSSVSVSCALPPGTALNYFGVEIAEDIGA